MFRPNDFICSVLKELHDSVVEKASINQSHIHSPLAIFSYVRIKGSTVGLYSIFTALYSQPAYRLMSLRLS